MNNEVPITTCLLFFIFMNLSGQIIVFLMSQIRDVDFEIDGIEQLKIHTEYQHVQSFKSEYKSLQGDRYRG